MCVVACARPHRFEFLIACCGRRDRPEGGVREVGLSLRQSHPADIGLLVVCSQ